jgi:hypothetical protein
MASIGHPDRF